MSIICSSNQGWLISHSDFISSIYEDVGSHSCKLKDDLFEIFVPYVKKNCRITQERQSIQVEKDEYADFKQEVFNIMKIYESMYSEFKSHFKEINPSIKSNEKALKFSSVVLNETLKYSIGNAHGVNSGNSSLQMINGQRFTLPKNCRFFNRDVSELQQYLSGEKFDLIQLDPPWWNKYIRRKRKTSNHAYNMMYDNDLKELDLKNILTDNGLVVVWCTNSMQHFNFLVNEIFPKWDVTFLAKWYWLKITLSGELVCNFSNPPGKQPFEQIIFGARNSKWMSNFPGGKVVMSVPSALHSHKPPLVDLLREFLKPEPHCLEIFARYLLPNWTSYGNEVLRFQHEVLYDIKLKNT